MASLISQGDYNTDITYTMDVRCPRNSDFFLELK